MYKTGEQKKKTRGKFLKLFWIFLLVVSSFTLGYYLKPSGSSRPVITGNSRSPFSGRPAPPLNFRTPPRR